MGFKITRGAAVAGWMPGIGDALRAAGNAAGVAMLSPVDPRFRTAAPPLFRMRVLARSVRLEVRRHTATRCSRGSWVELDRTESVPANARAWTKLSKFWAWFCVEAADGTTPKWVWATCRGKDFNRCVTVANANAADPVQATATPGRGSTCKGNPTKIGSFGYTPASGRRIATTEASALADRRHEARTRAQDRARATAGRIARVSFRPAGR
jgi:hypothetical protein